MTTKKTIELEDLIAETEQKILNNEFYEDTSIEYKDAIINVRIKPISQAKFVQLTKNVNQTEGAEFASHILQECILNKHDNKQFTLKQINELFTGGLATKLAFKCIEVSGLDMDNKTINF